MKSLRVKKNWIKDFNTAKSQFEELEIIYEFFKEGEYSIEIDPRETDDNSLLHLLECYVNLALLHSLCGFLTKFHIFTVSGHN